MRRSTAATITSLIASISVSACLTGADDDAGEDYALPPDDAKGDHFFAPTEHGTIDFDAGYQTAKLKAGALFHAWDFSLGGNATVLLHSRTPTIEGTQRDTVMYLYKEGVAGYIAKNDEAGPGWKYSEIEDGLDAGDYRIILKGKKSSTRGTITLSADCEGPGCYLDGWLDAMKRIYAEDRLEGFDDVDLEDAPQAVRDSVAMFETRFEDLHSLEVVGYETEDDGTMYLAEVYDEVSIGIEIYDSEGEVWATAMAPEGGEFEWE